MILGHFGPLVDNVAHILVSKNSVEAAIVSYRPDLAR